MAVCLNFKYIPNMKINPIEQDSKKDVYHIKIIKVYI